ncbi:hypothetical protein [Paracoccus sp. SCSIO 75233]|uniref:hypothetical protein n=1 Tax=Paracoccus sp. SCSIO 75233 TaxID=3017782 RepID=UPI0022F0E682|nr:hypothetical protein [Paracoccus sp. SCSIO 75233]WBU51887.1 hypothetical protein PAF12_08495 [Paracoccus sp. SCSIO 75233]
MIDEKSKYDPGRLLELNALAEAERARIRSLSDRRDELRERGHHWQRQLLNLRMDYAPSHDVGKAIEAAEAKIAELAAARQAIDRESAEVSEIRTARASNFQAALERAKELGLEIPLELDRGGSGLTSVPYLYEEASQ